MLTYTYINIVKRQRKLNLKELNQYFFFFYLRTAENNNYD